MAINQDMVKQLPHIIWSKAGDTDKDRWINDLQKGLNKIDVFSASVDLGSVTADSLLEVNITVTGVKSVDFLLCIAHPELTAGLMVSDEWIDTDDTVSINVENETTSNIDEAAGTWYFVVMRLKTNTL